MGTSDIIQLSAGSIKSLLYLRSHCSVLMHQNKGQSTVFVPCRVHAPFVSATISNCCFPKSFHENTFQKGTFEVKLSGNQTRWYTNNHV